jgi:hypothetical protein
MVNPTLQGFLTLGGFIDKGDSWFEGKLIDFSLYPK